MSINTVNNHPELVDDGRQQLMDKLRAKIRQAHDMQNIEQFSAKHRPQVDAKGNESRTLETLKAKCCQFKASCFRFVNKGRTRQDNSKDANTSNNNQALNNQ